MVERGQKLNEIEDQMENMSNEAKQYAQNAQALKNMYKNKKWYQLWTNIFLFYPFQECAYVLQPESSFLSSFFCDILKTIFQPPLTSEVILKWQKNRNWKLVLYYIKCDIFSLNTFKHVFFSFFPLHFVLCHGL